MKSARLALPCVLLSLALLACQRQPPLVVAPHTVPPHNLRLLERPLDPKRIAGAEMPDSAAPVTVAPGIAGDRITSLLQVPPSQCVVAIARGSQTIEDLDLLAYGEDGAALGSDEAADRQPALLICPPHPTRILIVARVAQGHGLVAIGSQSIAPSAARAAAQHYGVKPREPGEAGRLKAWPGLDDLIERERARIGGKFQDLRRVAVALDSAAPTTVPASIEAGRCVHALFIPSDDVAHLDVAALDDQGRIIGRGAGSGRQRSIVVCSPIATEVAFEVRPHAGRGLAVAALSRSVPGTESQIEGEIVRRDVYPSGDMGRELELDGARLKRLGYAAATPAQKLTLAVGQHSSTFLTLGSGCSRIDLVGAAPLRGVSARLWSTSGQLLAEGAGSSGTTLFGCGAGKVRLDASAELAAGPVSVLVRREPDAPAELSKAPLAGGRLVARMSARGVLPRADAIGKVTPYGLSADQLTSVPVMVPIARCVDVDVAIQGTAAGVELRAVEQPSGLELDTSVGETAASTRLCNLGRDAHASLEAVIELRAISTTATALVATRLLAPSE